MCQAAIKFAPNEINVVKVEAFTDMQAADKGTKLVDEDGLFSLVAAAPEMAVAAAKPEVKADGASALAAIPAGNFYAGKSSAANGKKAALSASSMAASGAPSPTRLSKRCLCKMDGLMGVYSLMSAAQELLLVNRCQGTALGQLNFSLTSGWHAHAMSVR